SRAGGKNRTRPDSPPIARRERKSVELDLKGVSWRESPRAPRGRGSVPARGFPEARDRRRGAVAISTEPAEYPLPRVTPWKWADPYVGVADECRPDDGQAARH